MVDLDLYGSHSTPIFDFSLSSVKGAGAIDITEFTIIGSTLVKCSNLINNGKRLENMSWRIMGKSLVSGEGENQSNSQSKSQQQLKNTNRNGDVVVNNNNGYSNQDQSLQNGDTQKQNQEFTNIKGLVPQHVFINAINNSRINGLPKKNSNKMNNNNSNNNSKKDIPKKPQKQQPTITNQKKLKPNDFNCIASIVTKPSLAQTLAQSKSNLKRNTSTGSGFSNNSNISLSSNNTTSLSTSFSKSKSFQRPNLVKRNSSKGKLTSFSLKSNNSNNTAANASTTHRKGLNNKVFSQSNINSSNSSGSLNNTGKGSQNKLRAQDASNTNNNASYIKNDPQETAVAYTSINHHLLPINQNHTSKRLFDSAAQPKDHSTNWDANFRGINYSNLLSKTNNANAYSPVVTQTILPNSHDAETKANNQITVNSNNSKNDVTNSSNDNNTSSQQLNSSVSPLRHYPGSVGSSGSQKLLSPKDPSPILLSKSGIKAIGTTSEINVEKEIKLNHQRSHSHSKSNSNNKSRRFSSNSNTITNVNDQTRDTRNKNKEDGKKASFFLRHDDESEDSKSRKSSLSSKLSMTPDQESKAHIPSLFNSRLKDKSSSGSLVSEDDDDDDDISDDDDDDDDDSDNSDSDFEIYSDDEHPVAKFKSKDSFTEKLAELKTEIGQQERVHLAKLKNNGSKDGSSSKGFFHNNDANSSLGSSNKSGLGPRNNTNTSSRSRKSAKFHDKHGSSLKKLNSNLSLVIQQENNDDNKSIDSTSRLLKKKSSLFPAQKNYDPVIFSDDSFSDDLYSTSGDDDSDDDDDNDDDNSSSYGKPQKGTKINKNVKNPGSNNRANDFTDEDDDEDDDDDRDDDDDDDDDNDAWTDDDNESNFSSIRFSKNEDATRSKPAAKKSLLSGLFLNEMNKTNNSSEESQRSSGNNSIHSKLSNNSITTTNLNRNNNRNCRANSSASKKSFASQNSNGNGACQNSSSTTAASSKIIYSSTGGLQLRMDLPAEGDAYIAQANSTAIENGGNGTRGGLTFKSASSGDNNEKKSKAIGDATRPLTYRNNSELLLKSQPSNTSLSTFASIQPVMVTNVKGTKSLDNYSSNKTNTNGGILSPSHGNDNGTIASTAPGKETSTSTATTVKSNKWSNVTTDNNIRRNKLERSSTAIDLRESLRKNSRSSSTSSFTNLLQMPFHLFGRSGSGATNAHPHGDVKPNVDDPYSTRNRVKLDLLQKRSSNAPPTAKSLLNTAYPSHMFHQQRPPLVATAANHRRQQQRTFYIGSNNSTSDYKSMFNAQQQQQQLRRGVSGGAGNVRGNSATVSSNQSHGDNDTNDALAAVSSVSGLSAVDDNLDSDVKLLNENVKANTNTSANTLASNPKLRTDLVVKESDIRSIVFGNYDKNSSTSGRKKQDGISMKNESGIEEEKEEKEEKDNDAFDDFEMDSYHNRGW